VSGKEKRRYLVNPPTEAVLTAPLALFGVKAVPGTVHSVRNTEVRKVVRWAAADSAISH
jgi:hypothetical protein